MRSMEAVAGLHKIQKIHTRILLVHLKAHGSLHQYHESNGHRYQSVLKPRLKSNPRIYILISLQLSHLTNQFSYHLFSSQTKTQKSKQFRERKWRAPEERERRALVVGRVAAQRRSRFLALSRPACSFRWVVSGVI